MPGVLGNVLVALPICEWVHSRLSFYSFIYIRCIPRVSSTVFEPCACAYVLA